MFCILVHGRNAVSTTAAIRVVIAAGPFASRLPSACCTHALPRTSQRPTKPFDLSSSMSLELGRGSRASGLVA
jgi:hypothetical protein